MPFHGHPELGPNPFIDYRSPGFCTENEFTMTVLRGQTRFSIKAQRANIRDPTFRDQLLNRRKVTLQDGRWYMKSEPIPSAVEKVFQHCVPTLKRLAPQVSLQLEDLGLHRFISAPTYDLEVFFTGRDVRIEGEHLCSFKPCFSMTSMRTADLPELCNTLPRFEAKDVIIAPIRDYKKTLDSIRGKVVTEGGVAMFFKPIFEGREGEFDRELRIMGRMRELGIDTTIRVPELKGLVVHGDETMGMLMTLIKSPEIGIHLRSPGFWDKTELRQKWETQVRGLVQELHAGDIVWGDVNPTNIVIDEAMDAWIVDFGGNCNVEFVSEDKKETVEGDFQGIRRVFEWLSKRGRGDEERYEEASN